MSRTMRSFTVGLFAVAVGCSDSSNAVTAPTPVASIRLTPTTVLLEPPRTRQLTALVFDAAGNTLDGREVLWSSDSPAVATVSATGLVQAVGRGYATIKATAGGKFAATTVTVTDPEPAEFDLVYQRRPFGGGGETRRISLAGGQNVVLPIAITVEGTFIRDVTPSPDGTRLAFTIAWYPEGQSMLDGDVYTVNIDGTNLRRLTNSIELDDQPAWSPDGSRIAFRSHRSGDWDIWVMNADGTEQRNLMESVLPATSTEATPAWSPDGSRIVYASDLDTFAYTKLWTMRVDGSDKRRLLPQATALGETDREPSWSPDGSSIAFRRVSAGAAGSDIMVTTVATGAVRRIALDGVQAFPAWSPDGGSIAFTSNHEGLLSHIYTMSPAGTGIVRHTSGDDENTYPRWLRAAAPALRAGAGDL